MTKLKNFGNLHISLWLIFIGILLSFIPIIFDDLYEQFGILTSIVFFVGVILIATGIILRLYMMFISPFVRKKQN
ncbi:MAG: hypothetical protein DRQ58_10295 [Gammaproteobacteria bacterium]|nr:MAG: hypothetical protein DRQ58_10295 [Gammaproteobacteria bacterium]